MKRVLDPEGTALDLAAAPLSIEHESVKLARKRINLLSSRGVSGVVPFGKAASDYIEITYKLRVDEQSTLEDALAVLRELSNLVDECEQNLPSGLPLEETPEGSETVSTIDVLIGEVEELPRETRGEQLGWYHNAPFAVVKLICKPFYRGPEESGGEVEGSDPLLELTVEDVKGDDDAEALAIVTDLAEVAKRYGEIGMESRFYDPEDPAPLLIEGDELETEGLQGEEVEAPEGAHSSKVIKADLTAGTVAICSTGAQPHIGAWRETLRFKASSTAVYLRLAYRVGDGPWGRGPWVQADIAEEWLERFLDSINIPQAAVGGQKWEGRIEAFGGAGDTLEIDYLECMPAERWVSLRAPAAEAVGKSETNSPGTVETGGGEGTAWENPSNAKASDDSRATVGLLGGESSEDLPMTNCGFALPEGAEPLTAKAEVERSNAEEAEGKSVLDNGPAEILVGGEPSGIKSQGDPGVPWPTADSIRSYEFDISSLTVADVNGEGFGFTLSAVAVGGVGGAERTARVDFGRITVYFTEEDEPDVICHQSQDLRIDHEEAERYDETGTYAAPVPDRGGGDFLLPPAGDRGRAVRVVSKMRKGDTQVEASDLADSKHKLVLSYVPQYRFNRDGAS